MSDHTWTSSNGTVYVYSGNNATCTIDVCPIQLSVYGYRPFLAVSIVMIVLYVVYIVCQLSLGIKYRSWSFMTMIITGCVVEILGYVGRILMWQDRWKQPGFIMQIVLITIGPVFFCAAIYVMLARIILFISPNMARFHPKYIYWIFIPCDVVSLVLQAVGGAMSSTSDGAPQSGVNIALAGLCFQVATLLTFVVLTIYYTIRTRLLWMLGSFSARFKRFALFLSLATIVIWIRCCYRVYELSQGYSRTSQALRDQTLFIALEASMVVFGAYCLILAHPGPAFDNGRDGDKAVRGAATSSEMMFLDGQRSK